METKRKNIIAVGITVCLCAGLSIGIAPETSVAEVESAVVQSDLDLKARYNKTDNIADIYTANWMTDGDGYTSVFEYDQWKETKDNLVADAEGIADSVIDKYAQYITEEEKEQIYTYETKMQNCTFINDYKQYEAELTSLIETIETRVPVSKQIVSSSYSTGSYSGSLADFLRDGRVQSNGYEYTYYSQSVLPGGGLNIPGRHTEDGFVKDGDGFICIASDLGRGAVIETPWGLAKSYDTGTAIKGNHIDVYVA